MSFHTPPHKHAGDAGKPGQVNYELEDLYNTCKVIADKYPSAKFHLASTDHIPSPTGRLTQSEPVIQDLSASAKIERTNCDRLLETFAGARECKLWWWPTDNGQ